VGDALGVSPGNRGRLVHELAAARGARGDDAATPTAGAAATLREVLAGLCCLSEVTEGLLHRLAEAAADRDEAAQLRSLIDDDSPIAGSDVLDLLRRFPSARPAPEAFTAALGAIKPRLYSISSSPKRHQGQVHLMVRRVVYDFNGRVRKGVASTMLADPVGPASPLRLFVHNSHAFPLPPPPT